MSRFRILVVDDFEPFRRLVVWTLRQRPELQVVGEAADGLQAVQQATQLQPDLILLDIGLPTLNGIEAVQQLRTLVPDAKILFVSVDASAEVVRESFRVGCRGYVHKGRAATDLLPAVDAVLAGERFVSRGLAVPDDGGERRRHEVQFYSDDAAWLAGVYGFLAAGLKTHDAAIVVATRTHRDALRARFEADRMDIDGAIERGRYIAQDADDVLSSILVNGLPDRGRFLAGFNAMIDAVANSSGTARPRVAIFGECCELLAAAGNMRGAIELEKSGADLTNAHHVEILCTYSLRCFHAPADDRAFQSICAAHTAVHSR